MMTRNFIQTPLLVLLTLCVGMPWSQIAYGEDRTDPCFPHGQLGRPFDYQPEFVAPTQTGRSETPLTCCDMGFWGMADCFGEEPCVDFLGGYESCSGAVFPLLADDNDNVYFWSGNHHFHAIDNRGNFRWRYDFVNPPRDSSCLQHEEGCLETRSDGIPTFIDYDGYIYFFIGDELHVLDVDGNLVLKHRIVIDGYEVFEENGFQLSLASGPRVPAISINAINASGQPALRTDGTFWVGYGSAPTPNANYEPVKNSQIGNGLLRLSRTGEILEKINAAAINGATHLSRQMVSLDHDENLVMTAGFVDEEGYTCQARALRGTETVAQLELASANCLPPPDCTSEWGIFESPPAIGPDGRGYTLSTNFGDFYMFDPSQGEVRHVLNFEADDTLSYQNRPIVDPNGTVYFIYDGYWGGTRMFAFDMDYLWENPEEWFPEEGWSNHPGVKWTSQAERPSSPGYSTPLLSKNRRLYAGADGMNAVDADDGTILWNYWTNIPSSAPIMLSDGTMVTSSGATGRIYFLKDLTSPNDGPMESGWPQAFHDNYHSNNAAHPHKWDRTKPRPYKSLSELLGNISDPCWNMADASWDGPTCLPDDYPGSEEPEDKGCAASSPAVFGLMLLMLLRMRRNNIFS